MTTATTASPILKKGSQGSAVKELQTLLNRYFSDLSIGGQIAVDGIFGSKTEENVKLVQYRSLLQRDGIVGPQTWQTLRTNRAPVAMKPILRRGSTGIDVGIVQQVLKDAGFYQSIVDQIFGLKTEAAVRAFQRRYELQVDGVVGSKTWSALESEALIQSFK